MAYRAFLDGLLRREYGVPESQREDLVQETLASAIATRDQYDPARGTVQAWLGGIARFRALALPRRRGAGRAVPLDEETAESVCTALNPEQALYARCLLERIEGALAPRLRAPFRLHAAGHSAAQIAALLGLTERQAVYRVRQATRTVDRALALLRKEQEDALDVRLCAIPVLGSAAGGVERGGGDGDVAPAAGSCSETDVGAAGDSALAPAPGSPAGWLSALRRLGTGVSLAAVALVAPLSDGPSQTGGVAITADARAMGVADGSAMGAADARAMSAAPAAGGPMVAMSGSGGVSAGDVQSVAKGLEAEVRPADASQGPRGTTPQDGVPDAVSAGAGVSPGAAVSAGAAVSPGGGARSGAARGAAVEGAGPERSDVLLRAVRERLRAAPLAGRRVSSR